MNIQNFLLKYIHQSCHLIKVGSFSSLLTVKKSTHIKFGNYQINGFITVSKRLNIPIEKLAREFMAVFHCNDFIKTIKFEKPGFINIFLQIPWIERQINYIASLPNFNIMINTPKTIVIDYSSPNIAKEMHVGHLRSTVIGDSIARILSFLGHNVIRTNHIGDWGTQFGMIIAYIKKNKPYNFSLKKIHKLSTLEYFYKESKKQYDNNTRFAQLARDYVVKLQKGDQYCQKLWKYLVNISILNNQKLYTKLNVTLKTTDIKGESTYRDMLPDIIKDLKNKKLAIISNNATIVPLKNSYINKHNQTPFGVIIQKQDGGYLYSTTEIACIKFRCEILHADRIIYYTDSRQKQHLMQAWKIADLAGYIKKTVSLEHHICGMLLNMDGKPFQTRSGDALKLITLINEAFNRARYLINNKNPNLGHKKLNKLANIISIGAIKYAELSKNRTTNYIFNWNNILNFEGNTALYIQYAYTRIFSIFRKLDRSNLKNKNFLIFLNKKEEISLAISLLQFEETITTVAKQGTPHILCSYLYKVSGCFSTFYENCPILSETDIHIKNSRLQLSLLTAYILKTGLHLLGIKIPEYL